MRNALTCARAIGLGSWAIAVYTAVLWVGLTSAVALTVGQSLPAADG